MPEHSHCKFCGDPIPFGEEYCDEECRKNEAAREAAEKWMAEKSIKGEHIYISSDDWNRLSHLFEFSSIPHAVLIGRDGKVIANGFRLSSADDLRKHLK